MIAWKIKLKCLFTTSFPLRLGTELEMSHVSMTCMLIYSFFYARKDSRVQHVQAFIHCASVVFIINVIVISLNIPVGWKISPNSLTYVEIPKPNEKSPIVDHLYLYVLFSDG